MYKKTFTACCLSIFLISCATTYDTSNSSVSTKYPHRSAPSSPDGAIILGSQKIGKSGSPFAVAKLIVTDQRGRSQQYFSQPLTSGTAELSIFIANNFQFVTADTQLDVKKGKKYFINFSLAYPSQVLKIGRIWISDEKGKKVKELKSWSQERSFGQAFGRNVS
jgi:hypothetical protein